MVTKKGGTKQTSKKGGAKKSGKLKLGKETIKNLPSSSKKGSGKGEKAACGCGASFSYPPQCSKVTGGD